MYLTVYLSYKGLKGALSEFCQMMLISESTETNRLILMEESDSRAKVCCHQ